MVVDRQVESNAARASRAPTRCYRHPVMLPKSKVEAKAVVGAQLDFPVNRRRAALSNSFSIEPDGHLGVSEK